MKIGTPVLVRETTRKFLIGNGKVSAYLMVIATKIT